MKTGTVMEAISAVYDEEGLGSTFSAGGFSRWDLLRSLAVSTGLPSDREPGEYQYCVFWLFHHDYIDWSIWGCVQS